MKKIIIIFILLLPSVYSDRIEINSGGNNELIIDSISKGEIGFFTKIPSALVEDIISVGGGTAGIGQKNYTLIEKTTECPEGYQLWNEKCYECIGQLARSGKDILCIQCGDNGYFDGEKCVYSELGFLNEDSVISFIILLIPVTLLVFLIAKERIIKKRKKKKKPIVEEEPYEEEQEEKPRKKVKKGAVKRNNTNY